MNDLTEIKEEFETQQTEVLKLLCEMQEFLNEQHEKQLCDIAKAIEEDDELPVDYDPRTEYERNISERKAYQEANPWILNYENSPRYTTPSKGQLRIHKCFEQYFGVEFKSDYFDWNRNHETGLRLELDGYNDDIKVAFEYNGSFFHYSNNAKFKDQCKVYNCEDYGVKLYSINQEDIDTELIKDDEQLYEAVVEFINRWE